MPVNLNTILKCFIVIQLVAVIGCKQNQSNKTSTRQTRIDNKAKNEQAAREAKEKARLEEEARKKAGAEGGTGSETGASGIEKPFQAGLKGKLASGSYVTSDNKKIELSGKDCTLVNVLSGPKGWIRLKFGDGLKDKIEIPVQKELIDNLKEFKSPAKSKVEKIANKSKSQIIFNRVSDKAGKDVIKLERSVITFKDKKAADLTDKDISDAIQRIKEEADNTDDLALESDVLNVSMNGKKYQSYTYVQKTYKDTTALPTEFLLGEKVDTDADITNGEGEEVSNLNCELKK